MNDFKKYPTFLNAKEVANILRKSPRWVYRNATILGGKKIAGSYLFSEEGLKNAVQGRQEMAGKNHNHGKKVHGSNGNKKRGARMGDRKAKGDKTERRELASRAGFTDFL